MNATRLTTPVLVLSLLVMASPRCPWGESAALEPAPQGAGSGRGRAAPSAESESPPAPTAFECDAMSRVGCAAGSVCLFTRRPNGDVGSQCVPGGCDPAKQDCPEGEKCGYVREAATVRRACVSAGPAREGEACTARGGSDTCGRGLFCLPRPTDGGSRFECARLCASDAGCPSGSGCNQVLRFANVAELGLACGPQEATCDLHGASCAEGRACYPAPDGTARCAPSGATAMGRPCEFMNQCVPGGACVAEAGRERRCRALCSTRLRVSPCPSGECRPLEGTEGTGVCAP